MLRFYSVNECSWPLLLDGYRDARDQASTANWNIDFRHIGQILQDLQTHCPLPSDQHRVRKGMNLSVTMASTQLYDFFLSSVGSNSVLDDFGSELCKRREFMRIDIFGKHHYAPSSKAC